MGDSVPAYQISTLFGVADDRHAEEILQVINTRDFPVTWSASLYSIGPGSQVYDSFFGEFPASHRNTFDDEYCFSSSDGRSIREDHPDIRGHASWILREVGKSICP